MFGVDSLFLSTMIQHKRIAIFPIVVVSSVQNEFETSTQSFKAEFIKSEDDTGNGTDNSDDGKWYLDDEPMKGTEGCLVAAYHAEKSTWKCYECGKHLIPPTLMFLSYIFFGFSFVAFFSLLFLIMNFFMLLCDLFFHA